MFHIRDVDYVIIRSSCRNNDIVMQLLLRCLCVLDEAGLKLLAGGFSLGLLV